MDPGHTDLLPNNTDPEGYLQVGSVLKVNSDDRLIVPVTNNFTNKYCGFSGFLPVSLDLLLFSVSCFEYLLKLGITELWTILM